MAKVLPFHGFRYAASRQGALSKLIAPPYDVVSPAHRAELAARSPHNIVHVTVGDDRPGDDASENKYLRAARDWTAWLEDGTVRRDAGPALYPLEQSFTGPDGRPRVRRAVIGACTLHRYEEGIVLPHEKTLAGPKADRLELLKHVKANLSPVFGLYDDDGGEGRRALDAAIASAGEPVAEADSDDGTRHRLWRVEGETATVLVRALAQRTVYIADGHHRYESALTYRDLVDEREPGLPAAAGHRFIMMALCAMSDPGLVIYPTHRLLGGLPGLRLDTLLDGLHRFFVVDTLAEDLRRPAGRAWAASKLSDHSGKSTTFLMVSAEDGKGRILTLRDDADFNGVPLPANITLRDVDVTALHVVVFEHLLGMGPRSQEQGENVRYEMDAGEVVTRTLSGEYQLAFLVNPTPMWQVQAVAESGETMPSKSTFFYPKLASGLVMRDVHEELVV
jgi:uncharacterized protein (DUF1015 family)